MNQPLFEPTYFNLEYFFNLVFTPFFLLADILAYVTGIGIASPDFPLLRPFFWFLTILFAFGILYSVYKYWKIREDEKQKYYEAHFAAAEAASQSERNRRWQKVLEYLDSPYESDWKLAIIEADVILGDLLGKMQYPGESIGEKLSVIEESDFTTIAEAREAHRARNRIAHEGGDFALTKREAERVVGLYRQVFEEFHYI